MTSVFFTTPLESVYAYSHVPTNILHYIAQIKKHSIWPAPGDSIASGDVPLCSTLSASDCFFNLSFQ